MVTDDWLQRLPWTPLKRCYPILYNYAWKVRGLIDLMSSAFPVGLLVRIRVLPYSRCPFVIQCTCFKINTHWRILFARGHRRGRNLSTLSARAWNHQPLFWLRLWVGLCNWYSDIVWHCNICTWYANGTITCVGAYLVFDWHWNMCTWYSEGTVTCVGLLGTPMAL